MAFEATHLVIASCAVSDAGSGLMHSAAANLAHEFQPVAYVEVVLPE
jgi:hypothetical protein